MHKCGADGCERKTLDKREHCTQCREQEIPENLDQLLPDSYESDEQVTLTDGGSRD